jgi:hypothetical protein
MFCLSDQLQESDLISSESRDDFVANPTHPAGQPYGHKGAASLWQLPVKEI